MSDKIHEQNPVVILGEIGDKIKSDPVIYASLNTILIMALKKSLDDHQKPNEMSESNKAIYVEARNVIAVNMAKYFLDDLTGVKELIY